MRVLALLLLMAAASGWAQTQSPAASATVAAPATTPVELAAGAPDKHVVVPGDTLWDIAGKFLEKPWRWPELWELNREQIRNPHLIYPGDIIYLDTSGARPRLRLARPVGSQAPSERAVLTVTAPEETGRSERLSPRVRVAPQTEEAIPLLNIAGIEPFLTRPLIVDEKGLKDSPRIIGTQEGRVYLGRGDLAHVRGLKDQTATDWFVYRSANALLDPDTRKPIAWEAEYVGTARLERRGDPASFRILGATEEIGLNDRLVPAERARPILVAPQAPQKEVRGRLVSVYRGVAQAGRNSVVAVNLGREAGIEVGHVLAIRERSRQILDRENRQNISLPGEPIGQVLVFRVFDRIAYGLIVQASKAVTVGDDIVNP